MVVGHSKISDHVPNEHLETLRTLHRRIYRLGCRTGAHGHEEGREDRLVEGFPQGCPAVSALSDTEYCATSDNSSQAARHSPPRCDLIRSSAHHLLVWNAYPVHPGDLTALAGGQSGNRCLAQETSLPACFRSASVRAVHVISMPPPPL